MNFNELVEYQYLVVALESFKGLDVPVIPRSSISSKKGMCALVRSHSNDDYFEKLLFFKAAFQERKSFLEGDLSFPFIFGQSELESAAKSVAEDTSYDDVIALLPKIYGRTRQRPVKSDHVFEPRSFEQTGMNGDANWELIEF